MSNINKEDLTVGTWVLMQYGFYNHDFCVLEAKDDHVKMGKPSWCVDSAEWMTKKRVIERSALILGKGKKRWWRVLLWLIDDVIFPFSKPKRNF